VSVAEEFQRLRHEQVVVLEDAAVAGVWVDAEPGIGQQLGEMERAARRQHRVVVAVDDQNRLVHIRQAYGRGALLPLRQGGDLGADRLIGYRGVADLGAFVQTGEEGVRGSLAGRSRREEQEVLGVLALGSRFPVSLALPRIVVLLVVTPRRFSVFVDRHGQDESSGAALGWSRHGSHPKAGRAAKISTRDNKPRPPAMDRDQPKPDKPLYRARSLNHPSRVESASGPLVSAVSESDPRRSR
jgi:hypothetical protein